MGSGSVTVRVHYYNPYLETDREVNLKSNEIFDAALDFLRNGSDIPGEKDMRAHDRFVFTAACLQETYGIACEANGRSKDNESALKFWGRVLKGVLAGIPIAGAIIAGLAALGVI